MFTLIKKNLATLFHGACIGVGNIIPGVSGGTIALVLGIYNRLIEAINNINLSTFKSILLLATFQRDHFESFQNEMKKIDAMFLTSLCFGAITSIFALTFIMSYLLRNHHDITYSFFWGLILFSVYVPYKLLKRKSWKEVIMASFAIAFVVFLSYIQNQQEAKSALELKKVLQLNNTKVLHSKINSSHKNATRLLQGIKINTKSTLKKRNRNYSQLYIYFFAAMLVISAMILPGISGSFLLLLLGLYSEVILAVKTLNFPICITFAAGCVLGLLLFSRLLSYLLKHYYNLTLAFLTGLIIGSLYGIWPFKTVIQISHRQFYGHNIFPGYNTQILYAIIAFVIGCFVVFLMNKVGDTLSKNSE